MNEVVAELDGSDFEDSEDDFDGYFRGGSRIEFRGVLIYRAR